MSRKLPEPNSDTSMSSPGDSPAKTSAKPESELGLRATVPGLTAGGWEELPMDRCVCGWIYRWRGLCLDNGTEELLLPKDRCGDFHQGEVGSGYAPEALRRTVTQGGTGEGNSGGAVGLEHPGSRRGSASTENTPLPSVEAGAGETLSGSVGSDPEASAVDKQKRRRVVAGGPKQGACAPADGSGTQPEGPADGAETGMVCEACGRLLPDSATRHVFRSGIHTVLRDLARSRYMGFRWVSLRASDFGASHLRKRVFIVAKLVAHGTPGGQGERREPSRGDGFTDGSYSELGDAADDNGRRGVGGTKAGTRPRRERRRGSSEPSAIILPYASAARLPDAGETPDQGTPRQFEWGEPGELCGAQLADSELEPNGPKQFDDSGEWSNSGAEHGSMSRIPGAFAPGPNDPRWPSLIRERPDLAPALESPICRVVDGVPSRMDRAMIDRTKRLRALGNAVVPQCAEYIGRIIMAYECERLSRLG